MNTPVSAENVSFLLFLNILLIGTTGGFCLGLSVGGVDLTPMRNRAPTVVFLWLLSFAVLPFAGKGSTGGLATYCFAAAASLAAVILSASGLNKVVRRHTKSL